MHIQSSKINASNIFVSFAHHHAARIKGVC
ncbi:hypothetical protein M3J09_002384 [Ascochyta lentis]